MADPNHLPFLDRLPVLGLLALATTGFIAILTETLPAGMLPQIGASLHVSQAMTGQIVTLYAVGSLTAAVPLTAALQGWRRRPKLLAAIAGFLAFNTITALSTSYVLTLGARFLAGVAAGLAWGIIAGYARLMVSGSQKGKGMAIAMAGTPIALSLGVPAGALLSSVVSWRMTFLLMSAITLILIAWVLWKVPDFPGQTAEKRFTVGRVFVMPGIRPVLVVVFFWMTAHNILYTYIAPFVSAAGLRTHVDLVLLIFGTAALLGLWVIGLFVDRWLRALVLMSLCGFALVSLALGISGTQPVVVYAAVVAWGMTFGGAATLLQTALADAAGDGLDIAQALSTTIWNLAIAVGGIAGGVLLETLGVRSFPWAIFALLFIAILVAWRTREHGFSAASPSRMAL